MLLTQDHKLLLLILRNIKIQWTHRSFRKKKVESRNIDLKAKQTILEYNQIFSGCLSDILSLFNFIHKMFRKQEEIEEVNDNLIKKESFWLYLCFLSKKTYRLFLKKRSTKQFDISSFL